MTAALGRERGMTLGTLVPFFGLTFALTWGIAAIVIAFFERVEALFGELGPSNPLFILAVYAPGIVGVFLVWRHDGVAGLSGFFRRLSLWRMPAAWWVFLILGVPAIFYVGAAMKGTLGAPLGFSSWTDVLPALTAALLLGPIEEFGWRGIALPILQRRFAPLWAGLILGLVWAIWHIPAFLVSGTPQEDWAFVPYFGGVVLLSVIVTPMFNASRGSLLVAVLLHFQANNPLWPDAQPWDALVLAVVAVIVVVLNWRALTSRESAVTEVHRIPDRTGRLAG